MHLPVPPKVSCRRSPRTGAIGQEQSLILRLSSHSTSEFLICDFLRIH